MCLPLLSAPLVTGLHDVEIGESSVKVDANRRRTASLVRTPESGSGVADDEPLGRGAGAPSDEGLEGALSKGISSVGTRGTGVKGVSLARLKILATAGRPSGVHTRTISRSKGIA